MKLHFKIFVFALLAATSLNAQKKNVFQPRPELKIHVGYMVNTGNNMLGKAHEPGVNLGFWTSPFSVYNFKIGFGFNYAQFKISDASLAGNIGHSDLFDFYGFVAYPVKISEKFEIESKAGIGGNKLRQKTGNNKFGNMKGASYLAGVNLEYEVAWPFEVFAGADYVYSRFSVKSYPDYGSFFKNADQLNFFAGIKFNMSKKKKNPQEESGNAQD